ncbi:MAG: DUF2889 domain-containing protein [Novosphingobium sp.]
MSANLGHYPPNPAYGSGTFRRRISFSAWGNGIQVSVLDDFHDMSVALLVEGGVIADVHARMDRFPKTSCPGATAALGRLRGMAADGTPPSLTADERGGQCTHLVDLARLGLAWMARGERAQTVEVALTDRDAARHQRLTIEVDGALALAWVLHDEVIAEPVEHCGQSLFGGFTRWVQDRFSPAEADLWRIAQMAVFVARGRAYIVDGPQPRRVSEEPARQGACYSFSGAAFETAFDNTGYVRDMSEGFPPSFKAAQENIKRGA